MFLVVSVLDDGIIGNLFMFIFLKFCDFYRILHIKHAQNFIISLDRGKSLCLKHELTELREPRKISQYGPHMVPFTV